MGGLEVYLMNVVPNGGILNRKNARNAKMFPDLAIIFISAHLVTKPVSDVPPPCEKKMSFVLRLVLEKI